MPIIFIRLESLYKKAGVLLLLPFVHFFDKNVSDNRVGEGHNRHFPKYGCMCVRMFCRN